MKNSLCVIAILLLFIFLSNGCKSIIRDPYSDTPTSGRIRIGSDETFRNIIDAELGVFHPIYAYSEITPVYIPENELFRNLLADTFKLVVASRNLNESEIQFFNNKNIFPRQTRIAIDGIALIVNKINVTPYLSLSQLSQIFTGEITQWDKVCNKEKPQDIIIVFDNQESSILRLVADSICRDKPISKRAYAMEFNQDVISYVSRTPGALGLIGVSYISDRDDSLQLSFLKEVNILAVSRDSIADVKNSYKPFQAYLSEGLYPLSRDIIVINAEPRNGLATGLASFLAGDKGQRILLKTGVLPAIAPARLVKVRDDF